MGSSQSTIFPTTSPRYANIHTRMRSTPQDGSVCSRFTRCGLFFGFGQWRTARSAAGASQADLPTRPCNENLANWRNCVAVSQNSKADCGRVTGNGTPVDPDLRFDLLRGFQDLQDTGQ